MMSDASLVILYLLIYRYKNDTELAISKADGISMWSSNRYLQMPITEAANIYCTGISTYCSGDKVLL